MMKDKKNIEQFLRNAPHAPVPSRLLERLEANITLTAPQKREPPPNVFAAIVKQKIPKLAAAAVLILAVGVAITFLNRFVTPAYAIEQTIEALREVSTVHVIGTTWDGHRFEAWNKINPQTGKAEWVCIDETPHGHKIASTPKGSCVWDKDGNVVRLTNRIISTNDFRYSRVLEDLSNRARNPRDGEQISIYREKDARTGKRLIVIWAVTKMQDYRVYIDPVTKLPVRIIYDRADNMKQICKTIDNISYNVELPQGMFDFEVPPEHVRDYSLLEDPNKGMPAEGMSHEEAGVKIVKEYWHALIDGNWNYVSQLRPVEDWKTDYRKDGPAELIEVRQPYPQRGCSGLIVPCVVRFTDGKVKEVELVVNYREINGQTSTIIVATWGWPKLLEEK
ncbi:MAG TPA: hypothetical protein VMW16_09790 [Sedimentisphaerales bacterium]|nr:hypothetical protein [Sedimentisphaerales bacterium]